MWQDRPRHPHAICARLIDSFLADADRLLADWAPAGWELSPLRRVVHRARPESASPEQEVVDLLGLGLWDVFSNNHRVVDEAGVACDLGTWRASGDFIAESLNRRYPHLDYTFDYIDFYMGTDLRGGCGRCRFGVHGRHAIDGRCLRACGCRWACSRAT